jgi:hypothetical protein
MKKQIKHIVLWLLVILAAPAVAQNVGITATNSDGNLSRLDGKITGLIYHITVQANSSFFLQKDWVTGSVVREDDVVFENVRMRYQANDDELIGYNDQLRTLFIVDKETVKEFRIPSENGEMHFIKLYFDGFDKGERYFREIYNGTYKLLAFHFVDEVKITPYTDRQGIMRDTQYRPAINYYLYNEKSGFHRLQKRRKSFFKIFPEKKKEIRKLFRKNHVLLLDEQALTQAFNILEEAGIMK